MAVNCVSVLVSGDGRISAALEQSSVMFYRISQGLRRAAAMPKLQAFL